MVNGIVERVVRACRRSIVCETEMVNASILKPQQSAGEVQELLIRPVT